jgi:hypothetical protein
MSKWVAESRLVKQIYRSVNKNSTLATKEPSLEDTICKVEKGRGKESKKMKEKLHSGKHWTNEQIRTPKIHE